MNEKKFIVGNWYKSEWGNYFKFRELKYNNFSSSEEIYRGKWNKVETNGYSGILDLEIDISEIQQYLPDGHPDKIIPNNNNHVESLIKLIKDVQKR